MATSSPSRLILKELTPRFDHEAINSMCFNPNATFLACGAQNGTCKIYHVQDQLLSNENNSTITIYMPKIRGSNAQSTSLTGNQPCGASLASKNSDGEEELVEVNSVTSVSFVSNTELLSGSNDGVIRLWRLDEENVVDSHNRHNYFYRRAHQVLLRFEDVVFSLAACSESRIVVACKLNMI
jgi:WD40 repeat protein